MVEVDIHSDIANKKEGIFLSMLGIENAVFSVDTIKQVFADNAEEQEFIFNIHCDGGSVSEGLAIYDIMRNSGKTIYTNIEGSCHSMAVTLLLAAPIENRTANRNARALIHNVYVYTYEAMNAEELRDLAEEVEKEQNAILDIYEDRTGSEREKLEELMNAEKQLNAKELLEYGFINKINNYNTNLKTKSMSKNRKKTNNMSRVDRFLRGLKNMLGETVNYDFTDEEGNLLFSTEREDDILEVGDAATPDGTYELTDGRVVTIEGGIITEIEENDEDETSEEVEILRNELREARDIIVDLRNQIKSNYQPSNRKRQPGGSSNRKTVDEIKNEVREKRNNMKGGK